MICLLSSTFFFESFDTGQSANHVGTPESPASQFGKYSLGVPCDTCCAIQHTHPRSKEMQPQQPAVTLQKIVRVNIIYKPARVKA